MPAPVIELNDVSLSLQGHPVLRDVRFSVRKGNFLALIGPNGGGKTSLLRLMIGLETPDAGVIRVLGKPPLEVSHRIGYVPQDVHINKRFPISALDVVLMGKLQPGMGRGRPTKADRMAAQDALARLGMGGLGDRHIGDLSGGQRQRVFVARALVTDPEILYLDEPTASIDTRGQSDLYRQLKELNRSTTIIMASHDVMALSSYVKSVACVNLSVHYHDEPEVTGEMINMYHCPVELVAHGLPHRVLHNH